MLYYAIVILVIGIVWFFYKEFRHQNALGQANGVILETLRNNASVMSASEIYHVILQAEINVSVDDLYYQLILLCESKHIRCYKEPEYNGNIIVSHGTYAIDTITDHNS